MAARGQLTREGLALFAILAFWQLPHFMAIAWMYRDDYAQAGFQMLPVVDPQGVRTSRQAVGFTLVLLPVSLCPFLFGLAGPIYLVSALVLGLIFIWYGIRFLQHVSNQRARQLFYVSILYLPLLLGVMALDKTK